MAQENQNVEAEKAEEKFSRLEKYVDGKYITTDELKKELPHFVNWLNKYFGERTLSKMLFFKKEGRVSVYFWTAENRYAISVVRYSKSSGDSGYIGCIMKKRKSLIGEFWTRGSDFPDGDYSEETVYRIARKILSYEIQDLEF